MHFRHSLKHLLSLNTGIWFCLFFIFLFFVFLCFRLNNLEFLNIQASKYYPGVTTRIDPQTTTTPLKIPTPTPNQGLDEYATLFQKYLTQECKGNFQFIRMPITFDMTGVKKLYTWTPLTCYNTKNTSGTGEASAVLMGEFDRVDLGNVSSITLSDFYSNQIRIGRYWQFIPQGREVYRDDSKNITLYVYSRYSDVGGAGPEGYPMANVVYMYRGFKSVPVKDHETILVTVEATALSAQNDPAYHDFMEAHTIIGQQVHINILPNTISETEYDGLVYQNFFADITNKSGVQKDRFNSFLNFLQSIQLKPDTLFKGN